MSSIKVVLLGESAVGKTSIITRFVENKFKQDTMSSLSANFVSKKIDLGNNKSIKFDIWDTAGQEKYRALAKIFYQDSKIVILVYDITNKNSFNELKNYWYEKVKENSSSDVIFAIAGNKCDLYEKEEVEKTEGEKFAKEIGAIFHETSALSSNGINELFTEIAMKFASPNVSSDNKTEENDKEEIHKLTLSNSNVNDKKVNVCC
jgi:small GTP-binding protein